MTPAAPASLLTMMGATGDLELFAVLRRQVGPADQGACSVFPDEDA